MIRKHVDEKSRLWNVSERGRELEMPYQEAVENYLRVALIRSGDSVTIKQVAWFTDTYAMASRVEPRVYSSLTMQRSVVRDFLFHTTVCSSLRLSVPENYFRKW